MHASDGHEGRTHCRRIRFLPVFLFFCLATAIVTLPQARLVTSHIGSHVDSLFSIWRLSWVSHHLDDPSALFNANIFHPEPNTLAYSDAMLLPGALAAPLFALGMAPVTIYNIFVLGTFVLSALAVCALVHQLTRSVAAGTIAGCIYAFSTHRLEHFDHLELLFSFWIPLSLYYFQAWLQSGRVLALVGASLCATAQVLSCIYHGVFLLTLYVVIAPVIGILRIRQGLFSRRTLLSLSVLVTLPACVLAIYSVPYLASRHRVGDRSIDEITSYSVRMTDLLSAHPNNRLYGGLTAEWGGAERHLFPGVIAASLALVGVMRNRHSSAWLYLACGLIGAVIMLGTNTPLYAVMHKFILPFRGLRVPARAFTLVSVSIAVFAGLGMAYLQKQRRLGSWLAALLVVGVLIECAASPSLRAVQAPSRIYHLLRRLPSGAVLEWPTATPDRLDANPDPVYMFNSLVHAAPLVNGYSGFYPDTYIELLEHLNDFPSPRSLDYLRQRHVRYVVVHFDSVTTERANDMRQRLGLSEMSLISSERLDGTDVSLYEVPIEGPSTL